tara:strand:- start:746 stop:865 length:120 start_codon:yes stop_codon:yes gene_type:complete
MPHAQWQLIVTFQNVVGVKVIALKKLKKIAPLRGAFFID